MKKIIFTISAVLCANLIHAQIKITATNTTVPASGAVVKLNVAALSSVKTSPAMGTNQVWNYSSLKDSFIYTFSLTPNKNSSFLSTDLVDTSETQTLFQGVNYRINNVYGEDASDVFEAGSYLNYQFQDISSLVGFGADTIYFPAQALVFTNRQNLIALPATYPGKWSNNYKKTLDFQLTIAPPANYKHAPCSKTTYVSTTDSVAGWGTLSIPSPNKASKPYPVLMVRRKTVTIDSLIINNGPPPALLLAGLGLKQGQVTTDYTVNFYAVGRAISMLTMDYGSDKTYTTPQSVNYTDDSVQSGIDNNQPLLADFTLYPNPSSQNVVNCRFVKTTSAAWTLKIMNMLGQQVAAQTVSGIGSFNIPLNISGVKGGLYIVNIIDENGNASSQPLSVVK
jgi:hypothetical protein